MLACNSKEMTKSELNLADLEHIINDLNRFSSWSFEDYKLHWERHPEDSFHYIPLKGGRHIPITASISKRFKNLAIRNAESDQERSSYDLRSFISQLKKQFAHTFIELKRPLDKSSSDKMVGKSLFKLKKSRKSITHFIPCEFLHKQHPSQFNIGKVTFHSSKGFSELYNERIQVKFEENKKRLEKTWQEMEKKGKKPTINPNFTRKDALATEEKLNRELKDFYHHLGWIAEVQVPPCLSDISFSRAKDSVNAALDVLKLFFGEKDGQKFRIAYDKGHTPRTSQLALSEKDEFCLSWSIDGSGALGFSEDWLEELKEKFPVELQLTGITINHLLDPKPTTPLFDKWLGALLWYGQGVSETSYAAKLIKYVAALEQLTITKVSSDLDISQTVRTRTQFLCGPILEEDKTGDTLEAINNMYKYRCDLIHGRISPSHPKIHETVSVSGRITQQALYTALRVFVYVSTERKDSLEDLEKEYNLHVPPGTMVSRKIKGSE